MGKRKRASRGAKTAGGGGEQQDHSAAIYDVLETVIMAVVLAFILRAFVVEAFVIPTGSMAPTLLGAHFDVRCEQCGYEFAVDRPRQRDLYEAVCPMCHCPNVLEADFRLNSGDRILVKKYLYSFQTPRRWDVVVFKNPVEPEKNFIKRLVGLPDEELRIIEGNVYTRDRGGSGRGESGEAGGSGARGAWRIARKSDRPRVQRAVWQPVYHSQYIPLDGGVSSDYRQGHMGRPWACPWRPEHADRWRMDGRAYHFGAEGGFGGGAEGGSEGDGGRGRLRFDWNVAWRGGNGIYAYNQISGPIRTVEEPIEDVRLAMGFEPREAGASLLLRTTARLDGKGDSGPQPVIAEIDSKGRASLYTEADLDGDVQRVELASGDVGPIPVGRARQIELWYVDQEASLWVEGVRVLQWGYDLPMETLLGRGGPDQAPAVSIEVTGRATLHRVELDRDLFYLSQRTSYPNTIGRAGVRKYGSSEPEVYPLELGSDQFFCMGDNSPRSDDGRFWDTPNPWIAERFFGGIEDAAGGVVPRQLMIGRAFAVYFPALVRMTPDGPPVGINFGELRLID